MAAGTTRRLLETARPYRGVFLLALLATLLASLLDGVTIVVLIPLLKANTQGFGSGPHPDYSAYMIDYDTDLIRFQTGNEPWPGLIGVPTELRPLLQSGKRSILERLFGR